jgi:type IV pilus assembly protein PilB
MVAIKSFSNILADMGLVNRAQIDEALTLRKKTGRHLGEILVQLGYLTQDQVADALTAYTGVPRINLDAVTIAPGVRELVPEELITRHRVLPFGYEGAALKVAMANPFDFVALDSIRAATRLDVIPTLTTEEQIVRAYDRNRLRASAQLVVEEMESDEKDEEESSILDDVGESSRVKVVNMIIVHGIRDRASDIHIEPQENQIRVRYRIDGHLRVVMEFPKRLRNEIVARIKVMAELDITERRRPQDGRLRVSYDGASVDLRVSVLPTIYGEKVVLRVLSRTENAVTIDDMGYHPTNLAAVKKMLARSEGIILVTGPTGSGKTTTLYSFLQQLNQPDRNIITIEDPVELRMGGITQINSNTRAGMTFASALRSVLRQDPDVVMVGEMRDHETAEIAVRAALTGHLVLSTLHTNSAAATLGRLIDMGIERFLLSDTVIGIVAQRLVRSLCANCSEPDPEGMESIANWLADVPETANIRRARGCTACSNTGFRGRIAVEEVLFLNGQLRRMIRAGESENDLEEAAVRTGMIRMKDAALQRVVDGKTTMDEIRGILSSEESGTAVVPGTRETPANEKESETDVGTEQDEERPSGQNLPESIGSTAPYSLAEYRGEAVSSNGHSNVNQNERHGDSRNPHFFEPHGVDDLENGHSLDIESVIQQVERPETNYALSAKWGFHATTTTSDAMEEAEHHQWIP